jgi:hypothetical protein
MISGEAYFRASAAREGAFPKDLEPLVTYLQRDAEPQYLRDRRTHQESYIKSNIVSTYLANLKQQEQLEQVSRLIESSKQVTLHNVAKKLKDKVHELKKWKAASDAEIMDATLVYFAALKEESSCARGQHMSDYQGIERNRKFAKLMRDIRYFNHYLGIETGHRVSIKRLAEDSVQLKRCKKVFNDKLKRHYAYPLRCDDVSVNLVFKLENTVLSDIVQVSPSCLGLSTY